MRNQKPIWWLLDNGHGGFIDSEYQSPGKQSPTLPNGEILYEGAFNREIVALIAQKCQSAGIRHMTLVPTPSDISIRKRTAFANQLNKEYSNCILVSIRLNKKGKDPHQKFSNSQGISTSFYRKDQKFWIWSRSDKKELISKKLARIFLQAMDYHTGMYNRGAKSSKHGQLRKLHMPAIISRCGYLNHLEDCKKLLSHEFRDRIATAHFEAMKFVEAYGLDKLDMSTANGHAFANVTQSFQAHS